MTERTYNTEGGRLAGTTSGSIRTADREFKDRGFAWRSQTRYRKPCQQSLGAAVAIAVVAENRRRERAAFRVPGGVDTVQALGRAIEQL
jgi:hypothetical protein